jgi:hypothetical protein
MGSLDEIIHENSPTYKPRKKKPELTYAADVIAHLERDLAGEHRLSRREELEAMLVEWQSFAE